MPVYVALLRGINVGGQKSIKMEDLRSSFETIGYKNVRSYVQSGNIVFSSGSSTNENQSRKIGKKILKDYGFSVNVMVRDSAEMSKIVRDSPFLK